ncbi:low molecular weight protein-tyrosine-phosphatase [Pasteurella multocida]|uniref:low molecular weight protein-tyrosine-phosphatase n=1 Tax=Pasteurella multocida TaxID=747 RepID=UPI002947AD18|nr:low molecular weight phosphotyrosine protein phosphatase [Pasteurella multocida]MEE3747600.1 low molecular weight protein-tyrosine-phosphatase [Pasteurella multocida]HDR0998625.1 low molecular weight phosphotyrosine protein phosphatase [Pasteurella multocida]HDR1014412.1 low molecular weight phosphotyrosine protein phosphatase [Pasteurella multocida]HDR1016954.1 low molecular weight phosphotyrosine protein phosphatase [Pasteurella multocida]
MFEQILVVCMGNICRSPVGEKLLQHYFPEKNITSAGLVTERSCLVDKPADDMMIKIASQHGLNLSAHRAKQLTHALCHKADLILVMEKAHIELVHQICPLSQGKVMLFGHGLTASKEIPDPYKKSQEMFEYAYQMLDSAAYQWKKML